MKNLLILCVFGMCFAAPSTPTAVQNPVMVKFRNKKILLSDLIFIIQSMFPNKDLRTLSKTEITQLIDFAKDVAIVREELSNLSTGVNLESSPEYKKQLSEFNKNFKVQMHVAEQIKNVSDAECRKAFAEFQANNTLKEHKIAIIISSDKAKINNAVQSLRANPASFSNVAQTLSIHESKTKGGVLESYISDEVLGQSFGKEALKKIKNLKKGEISNVIDLSNNMYLVVRVDDSRPLNLTYESIKSELAYRIFMSRIEKNIEKLGSEGQIVLYNEKGEEQPFKKISSNNIRN